MVLHPTPRDAIDNMIYTHSSISKYFIIFCWYILNLFQIVNCFPTEIITGTSIQVNLLQWESVWKSFNIYPKYKISSLESDTSDNCLRIKFHIYVVFAICSKHSIVGLGNLLLRNLF